MRVRYKDTEIGTIKDKKIFFDANILIYLFFSFGDNNKIKCYSNLYDKIKKSENDCIVDFVVLSETINRAHRMDYELYKDRNQLATAPRYKDYRNSKEGQDSLAKIYYMVDNVILNQFIIDGKICKSEDISSYLSSDNMDFNDKFIASLCQEKDYILLTDDVDYEQMNIEILSANSKLA